MLRRNRNRRKKSPPLLTTNNNNSSGGSSNAASGPPGARQDRSRLSHLVIDNPVNQAAHWSQDSYLLQDLVERFSLPQIIRCSDRLLPGEEQTLPVNIHVPLLLFSARSARKLLAKHVAPESKSNAGPVARLTETDESIVIPVDYDGHFLRLQARTTNDSSAVRSLQHIASNQVPAFINFTPVVSFFSDTDHHHHHHHHQQQQSYYRPHHPHYPLDTTTTGSINSSGYGGSAPNGAAYSGGGASKLSSKKSSSASAQKMTPQKKVINPPGSVFIVTGTTRGLASHKRRSRDVPLLRCQDEAKREVFIPIDQPGEFIEAEIPRNGSTKLSMLPPDLMAANRYPSLVRFVYGDHAPRLTPCSLMFTLVDTFTEDSVIGCLLYPGHAMLVEMPLMSSLSFQVALNRDAIMTLPLPRHAIQVIQSRRDTFVRDLKLKVKFLHRVNSSVNSGQPYDEGDEDLPSATVRARQFVNEAYFYL